jgi:hypothetical protein
VRADPTKKTNGHWRGRWAIRLTTSALGAMALLATGTVVAEATPATAPSPITVLTVQPGDQAALVTWTVPDDGGSPITGFQITVYTGPTNVAQATIPASTIGSALDPTPGAGDWFQVPGLAGGTPFRITVAAVNDAGTATADSGSAVTPSASPTAPYQAINVSVDTQQSYDATIHWTVPPNNGAAITSFDVAYVLVLPGEYAPTNVIVPAGPVGSALDPTAGAQDSYTFTNIALGNYLFAVSPTNPLGTEVPADLGPTPIEGGRLAVNTGSLDLGDSTLGDYVGPDDVTVTNMGNVPDAITDLTFSGQGADDYYAYFPDSCATAIAVNATCVIQVFFNPGALGTRAATMTIHDNSTTGVSVSLTGTGSTGYYVAGAAGEVGSFGDAGYYGDQFSTTLNKPIVGIAPVGNDGGYWLVASDGGIFSFGDAPFYGSTGAIHLNKPIVGMAVTPDGGGYWMVASDGGIFSFGDAAFFGSTGSLHLNKPIVGMAVTPDGGGYWLVASDGGIFSFGDAQFYGSTGDITLNKPIVGMAVTPDGSGYWMVASDGGIFSFGDARFFGSTGGVALGAPVVGISPMPDGNGYWLVTSGGHVYAFGSAPDLGRVTLQDGSTPTDAIGIATDGGPTAQAIFDVPADRIPGLGAHGRHYGGTTSPAHGPSAQWKTASAS